MSRIPSSTPFSIEHFKAIYQPFASQSLLRLPQVYSPEIIFKDPIHQVQGLAALKQYFARFCNPDIQCSFEFTHELLASEQAFFQWQMHYSHADLHRGQAMSLNGCSFIKFNSHIYYHEDFYDLGAMIYQHIPILGWAVKKINARLARS